MRIPQGTSRVPGLHYWIAWHKNGPSEGLGSIGVANTNHDLMFEWTDKAEDAFQELKAKFTEAPILVTFDPMRKIVLETDASDFAIGACLSQPDDKGKHKPVAYYSRKMSPAELNYDIHDKELLAIVEAFRQWRVYLEGPAYTVQVWTDHKNLTSFTTTKVLNRRQVRWAETL
ncbi:hypothetical protein V491_08680, partial [Pseudogymnoascus sp. VKM F-3775]